MTLFTLDDLLLVTILGGFVLGSLYVVTEVITWRFRRMAEIKALENIRALYRRSSRATRSLVSKMANRKA